MVRRSAIAPVFDTDVDTLESVASREPRVASFFQYVVAKYACTTARTANAVGRRSRFNATLREAICIYKFAIMDVYP